MVELSIYVGTLAVARNSPSLSVSKRDAMCQKLVGDHVTGMGLRFALGT